MSEDNSEKDGHYVFVVNHTGMRFTAGKDYFKLSVEPHSEINEQEAVKHMREWIRFRKAQEELRESGLVSG